MQHSQISYPNAEAVVAAVPDNQAVLLPPNQSEAHIEDFPWSDLYSVGQLASNGWHDMRHSSV